MRESLYLISSRQGFMADAERAMNGTLSARIAGRAALANGSTAGPAVEALRSGAASAILIDLDSEMADALQVVGEIRRLAPDACILAASSHRDADLILSAMRSGAADFLSLPLESGALSSALTRSSRRTGHQGSDGGSRGQVISFLGAKGGAGATTIAMNMAVALKSRPSGASRSVVLVDMDLPGGDVSAMLKLTPSWSLADVASNAHRIDMDLLGSLMTRHASGVQIIASADEGDHPAAPDAAQMAGVVAFLREHFDTVVLAGGGFSEPMMAALNQAHLIHVVSSLDFLSLRRAQSALARLRDFGVSEDCLRIVINRHDRGGDLTLSDVKEALGMPVCWSIPNDSRAAEKAVNEGMPVVSMAKGRLQASFEEYAERLAGGQEGRPASGFTGLFRRLVPTRAAATN